MIYTAAILSVAAVSTVAFQLRPSTYEQSTSASANNRRIPIPVGRNQQNSVGWSLPYASKANSQDLGTTKVPSISILSLLEAGRTDDAVVELRKSGNEVPASTYHAVIEACCAGGFEPKRNQKNTKNKDRIEIAAELLGSMEDVTAHAYEIVISGYARRGRWQDADQTLTALEEAFGSAEDTTKDSRPIISYNIYQTVLVALAKAHQFNHMNSLLVRMRRRGVRPNVYTYNSLLKICASHKIPRWKEALSLLSQCQREPGVNPDLITYTTAMRACARGKQAAKAMELFRAAKDLGMKLDVYFYTTAMDACAKDTRRNSWKNALSLLDEMKGEGIVPSEVTYGVAVTACGNGGQWKKALELLDRMRDVDLKINTITYNSAIAALSKAARSESKQHGNHVGGDSNDAELLWEKALDLIKCMEKEGVRRDSFTFSSAISTCGAAGQWQEAVDLIKAMKGDGIKPNKFAYTSAISACANSKQWEPAYQLFNDVKKDGIQPDIVAYNALIGAGMTAEKPKEVFDLWQHMCQSHDAKLSPDIVTLTEVIATLDNAAGKVNRERVDEVFSEAVARGLIMRQDSLDTSWEVDLSRMSFPVARAAVRHLFRQIVEKHGEGGGDEEGVKDLSLLTGASKMREYVRGVLRDELKPAVYCVVPEMAQGTLVAKEKVMRKYIEGQGQQ